MCASIWRVVTEDLVKFDELWSKYSLIGANRDQLSFDAARQLTSMEMHVLEYGFLAKEGFRQPGTMGMSFQKVGRKKLHPQIGHSKQYLERDKLLAELKKITGLHPFFYDKRDHTEFIMDNVIRPILPNS